MRRISVRGLLVLLIAAALIGIGSHQAIAQNRIQLAVAEARSQAANCRVESFSYCVACVEQNVVPQIVQKYRIQSRRDYSIIVDAARQGCK